MPSYIRCKATIPHSSGLPEYAVVNTWSIISTDPASRQGAAEEWVLRLEAFYAAFKNYMSSEYPMQGLTYEFIDLGDAKPRVPFHTALTAITAQASSLNDLPPEVSLCFSFRGATGSGLNAKRRRGRVYIGPLQIAAADSAAPTNTLVDLVAGAGANLEGSTYCQWAIHSPSTFHNVPVGGRLEDYPEEVPALLDDSFTPVTHYWVDNAWDTQRRRGKVRTYRKSFDV